jgi:hypothetical protein
MTIPVAGAGAIHPSRLGLLASAGVIPPMSSNTPSSFHVQSNEPINSPVSVPCVPSVAPVRTAHQEAMRQKFASSFRKASTNDDDTGSWKATYQPAHQTISSQQFNIQSTQSNIPSIPVTPINSNPIVPSIDTAAEPRARKRSRWDNN